MPKVSAHTVGFCVNDGNADVIADSLIRRLGERTADLESLANRLYRGRRAYDLSEGTKLDLERAIERLSYIAQTLREVQDAQSEPSCQQAAP